MLRLATFRHDITPPLGFPLCAGWYPPAASILHPLAALGVVLLPEDQPPIVLCALDWCELSNREHLRWRQGLAKAVGTDADRVAVHCIHAHDTPWPDGEAQELLDAAKVGPVIMQGDWADRVRIATAEAAAACLADAGPCTHVSHGQAKVERIASNRRIHGDDGTIKAVRWTRCRDAEVRAEPEGLIDPMLRAIGFWNEDRPIATLHYYTVHPTAIDGTGEVTPEFVGLARNRRSAASMGAPHLYFTGCAGNITAGKYNDGVEATREPFAQRLYDAMLAAERAAVKRPLMSLHWSVAPVHLPPREDLEEAALRARLNDPRVPKLGKSKAAIQLAYLLRGDLPIPVTALHLNEDLAILHLPGEAFIEFQLFAQEQRPNACVAVASYGDLGTGYICVEGSAEAGGYEPTDSFVSERSDAILRQAIAQVLSRR